VSMARVERALVSVSDKRGLVELCTRLAALRVTILSTGGTSRTLREAGIAVTDVSEYTGSPEIMEGRVKTLHPRVHGGLLMRDLPADRADLAAIGGAPIDLVVCNLYPFEATVARGAAHPEVLENIDIGGPCMIRAAAKNHPRVGVVVDPTDYQRVAASAETGLSDSLRAELAGKAFAHTAAYDRAIADYFGRGGPGA
jgi:phosphoribosylaminoimidazolecarboxamide formyltransferase / IMP cyclohydrolase